jgi:hypothetical protein
MIYCRTIAAHLAVLVLAGGIYCIQGPDFVQFPEDHLADAGDSILNTWILAWNSHAWFDPQLRVWDAPIFYPAKNTLAFSENLFGNLWLTLPFQYGTGNPILAFNVLVFVSFVLGMYGTFLLVRRLSGSFPAGVISGLLFSFNPLRWSEVCHVQLLPFFWAPIALLFCHQFLETRRTRWFFCSGLVLVAQTYTSIYLGIILFMTLLVFSAAYVFGEMSRAERWIGFKNYRFWCGIVACSILCMSALVPLEIPYLQSVHDWNFARSESENASFSCELLSFVVPNASFKTYQSWQELFQGHIRGFYGLGLAPWALAAAGWILMRRVRGYYSEEQTRVFRRFTWTALVMGIFMLGPYLIVFDYKTDIPLPYLLVYYVVPGAKAMRVPARYVFPLLLCLSIMGGFAVAYFVDWLRRRPGLACRSLSRSERAIAWRMVACLVGVQLFGLDYSVTENPGIQLPARGDFPPVYSYLARSNSGQPVLELPAHWQQQFRFLYFQTEHWRPLVGGETGSYPPAILEMTKRLHGPPTEESLRFLSLTPAQTVVVHLDQYDAATADAWSNADLRPEGFQSMGQIGAVLVWERQAPPAACSQSLRVQRLALDHSRGFLRDAWKIDLVVTAAESLLPWKFLERSMSQVELVITDGAGKVHRFTREVEMPPYLLAGESAALKIGKFRGIPKTIKHIHIQGPFILEYDEDLVAADG